MSLSALIVEDQAVTARDLQDIVTHLGYSVCGTAASFDEALAIADAKNPDIAILDIRLKGQLTGLDVAERLRETHDVPIIMLTSQSDANSVGRARKLRVNGYIIKPFTEEIIFAAIETAFGNFLDQQPVDDIQSEPQTGGLAPYKAKQVEQFIDENFTKTFRLDDLAAIAGLSRFHFAAMFKQTFGEPPHRFVILKRLEAAKKLLVETELSIAEIALEVGYSQQAYLATLFKRETGQSPSQYRNQASRH